MSDLPISMTEYVPFLTSIAYAIVIFIVGNTVGKWVQRLVVAMFARRGLDAALGGFFGAIGRYTVFAAATIAALDKVGVETTSLVAIFASAGLAIGFALQGSLSNFAAGVMILFFRPFDLADVISAAGTTGRVVDIGLFATTLATPDHRTHLLPNAAITGGTIVNLSKEGRIRGTVDVGVAYGADIQRVSEVLSAAASSAAHALSDPAPTVAFVNMGASSLDFQVHCFAAPDHLLQMLQEVRAACYDHLNAAGIDIPYQTITLLRGDG